MQFTCIIFEEYMEQNALFFIRIQEIHDQIFLLR